MSELSEEQFLEMTNLHSPETFSVKIEKMSVNMGISHMDAIFHYCDEKDIDLDIVHKLVNKSLKDTLFKASKIALLALFQFPLNRQID